MTSTQKEPQELKGEQAEQGEHENKNGEQINEQTGQTEPETPAPELAGQIAIKGFEDLEPGEDPERSEQAEAPKRKKARDSGALYFDDETGRITDYSGHDIGNNPEALAEYDRIFKKVRPDLYNAIITTSKSIDQLAAVYLILSSNKESGALFLDCLPQNKVEAVKAAAERQTQNAINAGKLQARAEAVESFLKKELQKNDYHGATLDALLYDRSPEALADPDDEQTALLLKAIEAAEAAAIKQPRGAYITDAHSRPGDIIPNKLAIISKKKYTKALDYISLFEAPEETEFDHAGRIVTKSRRIETEFDEQGNLYILTDDPEEVEASKIKLMTAKSHEVIEHFTRQNLDLFFSIISYNIIDGQINKGAAAIRPAISLDAYDLAEALGTPRSKGTTAINNAIKAVQEFQNFVGVLQNSSGPRPSEYAVLQFKKYDRQINRITIESPYITYLIKLIYRESLRHNEANEIQRSNTGKMLTRPFLSYLIHNELIKERDKAAIENVKIIIVLIEEAGNFPPHKSAREIINENALLKDRLERAKDTRRRNILLKRVFLNTWKYLKQDTDLLKEYPGIKIPDTWPTVQNIDIVFTFTNKGKQHAARR